MYVCTYVRKYVCTVHSKCFSTVHALETETVEKKTFLFLGFLFGDIRVCDLDYIQYHHKIKIF